MLGRQVPAAGDSDAGVRCQRGEGLPVLGAELWHAAGDQQFATHKGALRSCACRGPISRSGMGQYALFRPRCLLTVLHAFPGVSVQGLPANE